MAASLQIAPVPGRTGGPRLPPWALQRIGRYLDEHLGDNVRLDDLARVAAVSRFHFARCFRSSTGESPMAYLRRLRVERAKQLLALGGQPISDIAIAVGFYDQSHFTRQFTRLVGTTPARFARNREDGAELTDPAEPIGRGTRRCPK